MSEKMLTLDFWQDNLIYEGNTLPTGTIACEAQNVPTDTIARMQEQCDKLNLLLGALNAGQDAKRFYMEYDRLHTKIPSQSPRRRYHSLRSRAYLPTGTASSEQPE